MEEISSAIDQLAKGAQSQAQRVEETSKVMEQLNVSISQSAKSSEEAASASAQASQSAQNGADAVKTAIETMDKIGRGSIFMMIEIYFVTVTSGDINSDPTQ